MISKILSIYLFHNRSAHVTCFSNSMLFIELHVQVHSDGRNRTTVPIAVTNCFDIFYHRTRYQLWFDEFEKTLYVFMSKTRDIVLFLSLLYFPSLLQIRLANQS